MGTCFHTSAFVSGQCFSLTAKRHWFDPFFCFVLPILTVQRLPRPVRDYTAPPISMESITF